MSSSQFFLISSIVISGLMAGLFFGWSVSVIPGTARVQDRTYIETMQRINVAIVNPGFVVPFLGVPIVVGLAAWLAQRNGDSRRAWLLLVAAVMYTVGMLGVTLGRNVPLNNQLDAFDLSAAGPHEAAAMRAAYEGPWNQWHTVRTVAAVLTLGLAAVAATQE